ncbi:MAG TPA: response regulator [Terriglobales bacterium]|nr:response regulator [Terriglobales bacterium]
MTLHELATILLVEDEISDADLLRRAFGKAGVVNPIVHLRSGDEALGYLAGVGDYGDRVQHPLPALILLDLKLPGMTGLQLLQWMRTRAEVRRIPVVVLTTDATPATVNAAYDLGANSYLTKPGDTTEVARLVQAIQRYWVELNQPPPLVMGAGS